MQKFCPISNQQIDENVARTNAFFTIVLALLFVLLNQWLALLFLAVDFFIRGFINGNYSLLLMASKKVVRTFGFTKRLINSGPKIFAAQVGTLLTGLALLLFGFECHLICKVLASLVAFFALLECALAYCVACNIYPYFRNIFKFL